MISMQSLARFFLFGAALGLTVVLGACQSLPPQSVAQETTGLSLQSDAGWLKGYLTEAELPDSLALLLSPPTPGSAALQADAEAFRILTASSPARRQLAWNDAQLYSSVRSAW